MSSAPGRRTWGSPKALVAANQAHILGWASDVVPYQLTAVFTTTGMIADKPDLLKRFAKAYQRGVADYRAAFLRLDAQGKPTDELLLIDEVLTPDSSRFWPANEYQPGRDQNSYDKQYLRNYLLQLVKAGTWHKQPPGPELPEEITRNTLARYEDARQQLFG